ncbi:MAG: polysaccharide biosynthesis protein [Roseivirga sp.]|nr:polysaccharide biosynthesis protein [Roseivirga sp.]
MLFLISPPLLSQSLSSTDLTTIKVDDLSDEQLINYMQQAEASGYTQEQLEAFARQRGLPEVEIAKLRRRVSQLKLAMGQNSNGVNATGMRAPLDMTEEEVFGRLANSDLNNPLDSEEPMIFGFDLFKSDNLNFSPNLNIPTPTDYVLGPGDGIIVDLWGATQQYWNFEVSSEGTVRPPDLSPVYVNGLTMKEAQVKIINRLSQIYGGLKPIDNSDPTIFYQVSLGNIRTINVTIVGEVQSPGNYALNSLSTVFTGLHAAGGPTDRGTFRSIRLMRDNKLKTEIDLYDFLVDGIKPNDELLRAGDVIVVKLYEGQVELAGEVRRPGLYEIKEGDSFKDLLQNAGNFSSNAFKAFITVERNADNGKVVLNLAADELDKNYPADGDIVSVRPNLETFSNRVQLEGAVQIDGAYELTDNLTVKALIEKASGPRGDAYMERATIYRMNADLSQQTIPFNLQGVLSGADADIPLMREDIVRVSSIYELTEEYYVEISGEVALTGTYPFIHGMTVEDVILLAGGLTAGASGAKVEISRRNTGGVTNSLSEIITLNIDKNLSVRGAAQEIALNPFDQIFIRRTPNYNLQQQITVEGEITSPGAYAISRKDERVSDIMKRAGGLTPYAYPEGAILIRRTEFTQKKSPKELNFAKLKELRDKILADTSLAVNQARNELILRLESRIESLGEEFDQEESIGSTFKKRLTENISVVDSMASPVELSDREPTVLDLNKILENPGSKYDYIIREGDVISIPGKLETVRIAGEVISPLNLRYDDSFSFKDYVNDAGGFTSNAKKGRTYVQMADGRRKQTRRFLFFKFYPKVEPGSTIFVSRKPDRAPVNLQSAIAAVGSIATLALVIDRLSN